MVFCVQSMQAKQGSLLERVDALDQECEELQNQLGEGEDRQTDLQEKLQHISEERTEVQAQLIQQQAILNDTTPKEFNRSMNLW